MIWKYAILVSYVGTGFCGWQKQKAALGNHAPSIQGWIEDSLFRITQERVSIVGSGRTDAGVHAAGQVAHFVLREKHWSPEILKKGLNSLLRNTVQVLAIQEVALDFHAQRSAEKKQYSYYFQQGPCAIPHLEPYSWWIRKKLNLDHMNQALQFLVGEHDFKPFQASGAKPGPTRRTVCEAQVSLEPIFFPGSLHTSHLVRVRVVGTGFLKQMVRGIAGTLLQVGEDRRDPSCLDEILRTQDRQKVGPTAPARALWLEKVWYPSTSFMDWSSSERSL